MRVGYRWLRSRFVAIAERGNMLAPVEGRLRPLMSAADADAWLRGELPPSIAAQRAHGKIALAAQGADVG